MRVAIDARWNYHPGVSVYVSHLLQALPGPSAERGIEIIAYESPERPNQYSHPNLRKIKIDSRCYSPRAQLELTKRARQDGICLFHSPGYWIPFFLNCPVLATLHDVIPFLFPYTSFAHRELVKAGYRASVKFAAHIVCNSDKTKQDILRTLTPPPDKVTRVYNYLDTSLFSPVPLQQERDYLRDRYGIHGPYVLTLSASNWQTKNLDVALRSIEFARDCSAIDFQTVVVGSSVGLEQTGLKASLRNIIVTGYVPREDLPKLYRNATVFATLSKYEGFGYPLAEAMACGAAVICSRGGSLPEIAGDGALICDGNDILVVAAAIVDLLAHPEKRHALSTKAIRRAKSFSIEAHVDNMLNLYQRLAGCTS